MQPHPAELEALDKAIQEFDDAYVNVIQAVRRIQRIYALESKPDPIPTKKSPPSYQLSARPVDGHGGKTCPKCYSFHLIHKGGGCLVCRDCHFDLGCGSL